MVTVPHAACLAWARDRKQEDTRARRCSALGMLSGREGFQADRMELAFRFHSRESSSRVCKSQPPPPRRSVRVWFPPLSLFCFLGCKNSRSSPSPRLLPPSFSLPCVSFTAQALAGLRLWCVACPGPAPPWSWRVGEVSVVCVTPL